MSWDCTGDAVAFTLAAGPLLEAAPDKNTLLLSALAQARHPSAAQAALFGSWRRSAHGMVEAGFVWTPPHLVAFTSLPEGAVAELAAVVESDTRAASGVIGDEASARGFEGAWLRRTGRRMRERLRTRLYRLAAPPAPLSAPGGRFRRATSGDRELLLDWCAAFEQETGERIADITSLVDERLSHGGWGLWEARSVPVAMAAVTRPIAAMVRVTSVYTPPPYRGQGYATAVTGEISRRALAGGAEHVVLFADVSNPRSNGIYQRIGFRPLGDYLLRGFEGGHT